MSRGEWFDGDTVNSTNVSGLGIAGDLDLRHRVLPGRGRRRQDLLRHHLPLDRVAKSLLGQGDDEFTITDTLVTTAQHGGITVVHGGGNTSPTAGDTAHRRTARRWWYGDTSQDGDALQRRVRFVSVNRSPSTTPTATSIDASARPQHHAYGGAGNDTIRGSQAGRPPVRRLAADDDLRRGGRRPHLRRLRHQRRRQHRVSRVETVNASALQEPRRPVPERHDPRQAGDDIVFGDHGLIDQSAGTLRILTTGNVTRIATVAGQWRRPTRSPATRAWTASWAATAATSSPAAPRATSSSATTGCDYTMDGDLSRGT